MPGSQRIPCRLAAAFVLAAATLAHAQDQPPEVDGVVVAEFDAPLAFPVGGAIATINAAPGQRVEAGQTLATLNDAEARAAVALARAAAENDVEVRLAQAKLDAAKEAAEAAPARSDRTNRAPSAAAEAARAEAQQAVRIAELELERARLNHTLAQRQLDAALARQAAHALKTPIAGVVERIYLTPGQYAQPGAPVLRLVQSRRRFVEATVPSDLADAIKVGDTLRVRPRGQSETTYDAKIVHLDATIDPQTDSRFARLSLPEDATLTVGATVTLVLPPRTSGSASASASSSPADH